MARIAVLLLLIAACVSASSLFGASPARVNMTQLLLDLNMTMEQLFSPLGSSDFVYSYSQSAAHFTGPRYDNQGDIDVYGCSGLQGVSCAGAGECRNNPAAECCKNCGPVARG
jgi:hypothetical protein